MSRSPLVATADPGAFLGPPARRYWVARAFCFWQDGARAFGTIVFGRPDEHDVARMLDVFEVGSDPRFTGHASIVDVRALEAIDVLAFEALLRYLIARRGAWTPHVGRQAIVHRGGFSSAAIVGAMRVVRPGYPIEDFEHDARAAFTWCGVPDLHDEVESLRASLLEVPDVVRGVRAVLRARGLLPVDDLAEALGMSARSLQRRLEEAGTSLRRERQRHVALEAERLLAGTDLDLEAIAAQLGLRSASHLVRMFQQSHGTTPGAWRAARRRV